MRGLGIALVAATIAACGSRTGLRAFDASTRDGGQDALVEVRDVGTDAGTDAPACDALSIRFVPTAHAQIAVWASSGDRFATLSLTDATARRGIGNRPGAMQMNSGYHWPYGRRESVLPVWASSRLAAGGAPFRRVIFQRMGQEGGASHYDGSTPDPYGCLPFTPSQTRRDGLDAVSCASPFSGDRGRYITADDVTAGYAEPFETAAGVGTMRMLSLTSPYPPRHDAPAQSGDSDDYAHFGADALAIMPELDAITQATPTGGGEVTIDWTVPADWPRGELHVSVEINVEGDYDAVYDPTSYPTPTTPAGAWNTWSQSYGYPYRGQPSVVFDLDVTCGAPASVGAPTRRGVVDASMTEMPMDATMVDDPVTSPGSGADRLRAGTDGARVHASLR